MGLALKMLRTRQGLTQQQAADAMGVTRAAWQNYEVGRAIILRTDVQARLAAALNSDRDELLLQLQALTPERDRRSVSALTTKDRRDDAGSDRQQAVFPLAEGEVVLTFPNNLTEQGFSELSEFLNLFMRTRRAREP